MRFSPLKCKKSASTKVTAALATFLFTFNSVLPAAPGVLINSPPVQTADSAKSFQWLQKLEIPESLGRVESVFVPSGADNFEGPVVIHIQDAHTHAEAQRHIEGLLDELQSRGFISRVSVEGASGPLEPEILKVSSQDSVNLALADYLLNLGELTGVERFALRNGGRLPILGAEDPSLYRESYAVFTQVKRLEEETKPVLAAYARELERLQIQILPKSVHEYVMRSSEWHKHEEASFRYIDLLARYSADYLGMDFSDPRLQFEWPSFVRLWALQKMESEISVETCAKELESVLEKFAQGQNPPGWEDEKKAFVIQRLKDLFSENPAASWLPDSRYPEIQSVRALMELFKQGAAAKKLDLMTYPQFLRKAGIAILREEVDAKLLFGEIERVEKALEEKIAVSEQQKEILSLTRDFRILEKLLSLTVSREEFDFYAQRARYFSPQVFHDRMLAVSGKNRKFSGAQLFSKEHLELADRFYKLSRRRDEVLLEKTLKNASGQAVVLITGGFHSQGVTELLKQRNIPHVVIAPKMSQLGDEGLYEKVMMGSHVMEAFKTPASDSLVKMMLSQSPAVYGALNPGSSAEQAALVSLAIQEVVIPALRQRGISERDIYNELSRWVQETGIFVGTPFAVSLDTASRSVILTGEPQENASVRSELRTGPESDTLEWIAENLPEDANRQKVIDAIAAVNKKKQEDYAAEAGADSGVSLSEYLLQMSAESIPQGRAGFIRDISRIENLLSEIERAFDIKKLSLAHRAAFALGAFDETNFPIIHDALRSAFGEIRFEDHRYSEDLSAEEYARLAAKFSEAVSRETVQENLIIRSVLTELVFDVPGAARRALEKENLVNELIRELQQPGKGKIPKLVFLTDLHGSTKVGAFIAFALDIDNYTGITSPAELEKRLVEDWKIKNPGVAVKSVDEILEERNVLIVGGSDYVDRGPKPYWGFQFNSWLREHGLLKFINGNHDLWKDWNVIGMHLRVHDTLREIAVSGKFSEADLEENLSRIRRYVTTVGWDPEKDRTKFENTEAEIREAMRSFMSAMEQGTVNDAVIETFADRIIDSGNNANHSLEWWSREWGIHGGWFDTFLDQINEELVNEAIDAANAAISGDPNAQARLLAMFQDEGALPEEIRPYVAAWRQKLTDGKPMFDRVEASLFSKGDDVKALKVEIERIKKANAEIRTQNEKLAAQKRFGEMTAQFKVPSAFVLTSQAAQNEMTQIITALETINELLPGLNLPVPVSEMVTQQNYRTNGSVAETALWDWKNFRLLYTDVYDNVYVHGIIPVDVDKLDFNVEYRNPRGETFKGIAAIERIQYEVRTFFEKYDTLPDTAEFRAALDAQLGPAFQVLNEWYSDVLGFLKPESIQGFLKSGGAKSYPFGQGSDLSPREFNGTAGTMHVGHVESAKLRKQKLSYWVGGMEGGLLHGDFEMSEGYSGLGAIVQWFSRNGQGELRGFSRFGFKESAAFYTNQIKEKEKKLKEAAAATAQARVDLKEESEIQRLAAQEAKIQTDISALKLQREALVSRGERMEDITFYDDLTAADAEKIRPFTRGGDLARYYIDRFLRENKEAYRKLKESASSPDRAAFYERRERDMRERLERFQKQETERLVDILAGMKPELIPMFAPVRQALSHQDYASARASLTPLTLLPDLEEDFLSVLEQTARTLELFARSELRGDIIETPAFSFPDMAGSPTEALGLFAASQILKPRQDSIPLFHESRGIVPKSLTDEKYQAALPQEVLDREGALARSELRTIDVDMGQFLDEFPQHVLNLWVKNTAAKNTTLIAFSGAEADGKSTAARAAAEKIEALRSANKEAYPLKDNTAVTRVISLDRWFLERYRRADSSNERKKFTAKWALEPDSDYLYGTTPFNIQSALRALRNGEAAFAPVFLNSIKQRVRISDPSSFLDPASQNIRSSQVSQFHEQIKQDLEFLMRYKKPDAQTIDVQGRPIVRLFTTGHQWNFVIPDSEPDRKRMHDIEHRIYKSIEAFGRETDYRFDQSHFYLDIKTGDVVERILPDSHILFIEGVVSLLPELGSAPQELYDETVWVSAGMPATLEEALQDQVTQVRLWRYLYRRVKEGRMAGVSVPQLVKEFRERQKRELPIIFAQRPLNHYRVNSLSDEEIQKIKTLEQVVPVVIAFDVGGGAISLAHEVMQRGKDGFSLLFTGKLDDTFSEPTRSREGLNGEGRDKVLAQLAILAIERIMKLQADYPGRPIMPILAIGAPGNTAHPNFGESIAPRSADNLGTDFDGVVPDVKLRELIELFSGLNLRVVWKNDSLAQAYAAVSELLPNHPEYLDDTVLFLSLGTGLGMGIVKVGSNGDSFDTVGDSHNFDLDFTEQFPVIQHPVYGESFKVSTPGGDVYVPTSEKGKVRAEDLVSGRAIRQILNAFERQASDREQQFGPDALRPSQRPIFLKMAGRAYQSIMADRDARVKFLNDNNIEVPIHKELVLNGYEAIHPHDRDKLRQIIQHEYTKTPINGWLLNQLAEHQHDEFSEYSDQIEAWVEWIAEFLANRTLDVIVRTRAGNMAKTNSAVSWPSEWEQQLRELNLHHIVVGSGVATEGLIAGIFRSKLKSKLQAKFPDEEITLNVVQSMPKAAGIKGARLYVNPVDAQKELAFSLAGDTNVYLDAPPFYKDTTVDREQQKSLALQRPRLAVLLDLGDALLSKDKPLPEQTKKIINTLVNKGIPVGVATGKPLPEVYELFGEDPDRKGNKFADKLFVYALNGSVIHAPMQMREVYPGEIIFFDEQTIAFIEHYLMRELGSAGFGPAAVYPDKSDLTRPSPEKRSFEGPGPKGSRINMTAILGDRNPNFHRQTTAYILNYMAAAQGLGDKISADVAGRIGLDLSATNKGTAESHFTALITRQTMPVTIERAMDESRRLGIERDPGARIDRGDILKIFDLYQNGLGMDAQMADPFSYSVGVKDVASQHDVRAPVMIGGGPDQTPIILSQTRFLDEAGKIFRVNVDGSVVYEKAPATANVFNPKSLNETGEEQYRDWIQAVLAGKIGYDEEGRLHTDMPMSSSWTGWALLPNQSAQRIRNIEQYADKTRGRFERVVVIAMGGPGNAANLLLKYYNKKTVVIVDHLDPANLKKVSGDLSKTLFVVSSKSGTTVEILSMMEYYRKALTEQGLRPKDHFAIITDTASPMNLPDAADKIFVNDYDRDRIGDLGGRFSIGSYFGYVPAALGGVDVEAVNKSMGAAQRQYQQGENAADLLGVRLAEVLAQARETGRNKVTLVIPPLLEPFSQWLEQLFNESLGKGDRPLMVVSGENYSLNPAVYGQDRIFLRIHFGEAETFEVRDEQGMPVIDIRMSGADKLGALLYHMMMAVTLAGFRLNVNPFDQPAVEQSKRNARELVQTHLEGFGTDLIAHPSENLRVVGTDTAVILTPKNQEITTPEFPEFSTENILTAFLGNLRPGQYVALLSATYEDERLQSVMQSIRTDLRDRLKSHPATLVGTISKDNHANLQLHAAPGNLEPAVIIFSFEQDASKDIPLSAEALASLGFAGEYSSSLTYAQLNQLIAQGEFKALADAGKKVLFVQLPGHFREKPEALKNFFEHALINLQSEDEALPARSELRGDQNEEIQRRWLAATQRVYRAEISDVDGNITPTWGSEVPDSVIDIIRNNLRAGIPQGIASVRSEEGAQGLKDIEDRILAGLDPESVSRYLFFSENGTFVHWQEWDVETGSFKRHKLDIAKLFGKVAQDYVMRDEERAYVYDALEEHLSARLGGKITKYKEGKAYGFLATVERQPMWTDTDYSEQVAKATAEAIDFFSTSKDRVLSTYDAMMTRTSIVVMKKDVNKSLAIEYFSKRYNIPLDEIVGTDDQASREGNGWFLTRHAAGFSTNENNPKSDSQIPLKDLFGIAGVDAWLRMHTFLNFRAPESGSGNLGPRSELRSTFYYDADRKSILTEVPAKLALNLGAYGRDDQGNVVNLVESNFPPAQRRAQITNTVHNRVFDGFLRDLVGDPNFSLTDIYGVKSPERFFAFLRGSIAHGTASVDQLQWRVEKKEWILTLNGHDIRIHVEPADAENLKEKTDYLIDFSDPDLTRETAEQREQRLRDLQKATSLKRVFAFSGDEDPATAVVAPGINEPDFTEPENAFIGVASPLTLAVAQVLSVIEKAFPEEFDIFSSILAARPLSGDSGHIAFVRDKQFGEALKGLFPKLAPSASPTVASVVEFDVPKGAGHVRLFLVPKQGSRFAQVAAVTNKDEKAALIKSLQKEINKAFETSAQGDQAPFLRFAGEEYLSSLTGLRDPHAVVFDSQATAVVEGGNVELYFHMNDIGYAAALSETLKKFLIKDIPMISAVQRDAFIEGLSRGSWRKDTIPANSVRIAPRFVATGDEIGFGIIGVRGRIGKQIHQLLAGNPNYVPEFWIGVQDVDTLIQQFKEDVGQGPMDVVQDDEVYVLEKGKDSTKDSVLLKSKKTGQYLLNLRTGQPLAIPYYNITMKAQANPEAFSRHMRETLGDALDRVETIFNAAGFGLDRNDPYYEPFLEGKKLKRIILTAPAKGDVDITVVRGINERALAKAVENTEPGKVLFCSAASCTTNGLGRALIEFVGVLEKAGFPSESVRFMTHHAMTPSQGALFGAASAGKSQRTAGDPNMSAMLEATGANKVLVEVWSAFKGRLSGISHRDSNYSGSVVMATAFIKPGSTPYPTVEQINEAFKEITNREDLKEVLSYKPGVFSTAQIAGDRTTSMFLPEFTKVEIGKNGAAVTVVVGYDNEAGYTQAVVRFDQLLAMATRQVVPPTALEPVAVQDKSLENGIYIQRYQALLNRVLGYESSTDLQLDGELGDLFRGALQKLKTELDRNSTPAGGSAVLGALREAFRTIQNIGGPQNVAFRQVEHDFENSISEIEDALKEPASPSARSELRQQNSNTFQAWRDNYQQGLPFLGSRYEDRRWVAVHMTRGIFAVIPANLAPAIRSAVRSFVQRDLFYFDQPFERPLDALREAPGVETSLEQPGLEISMTSQIDNPDAHFLAVGDLLARKPKAYIFEILVGGNAQEAENLKRTFSEDPSYARFADRYQIAAVSSRDLAKTLQEAVSSVFNRVQGTSDAGTLADFIERHVVFSSPDRETLLSGVAHTGWLVYDDLGRHPGLVAARMDRSVSLAAGQLEAELIRKLGEIKALRQVITASGALLSGMNLQLIEELWNKEMSQRWFYKSA